MTYAISMRPCSWRPHGDITVVSKRLGHASVKTTADLYAHVTARLQEDAATRIGTLVEGAPEFGSGRLKLDSSAAGNAS
jgi:integrase